MSLFQLKSGKLIDTTMSETAPIGQFTEANMTDEIAIALLRKNIGYLKFFSKHPSIELIKRLIKGVRENPVNFEELAGELSIAVIIPTRGDRPELLEYAYEQIRKQTLQPDDVITIDYEPISKVKDICKRYKDGYNQAKGYDIVVPWEDDDYYSPWYLENQKRLWLSNPDLELIGSNATIYYHIGTRRYMIIQTTGHSSMFNTTIRGGLKLNWPPEVDPFVDLHLWQNHVGKHFDISKLAIGIKHGVGLCGGRGHSPEMCKEDDQSGEFLQGIVGPEAFKFYTDYAKRKLQ